MRKWSVGHEVADLILSAVFANSASERALTSSVASSAKAPMSISPAGAGGAHQFGTGASLGSGKSGF